MIPRWADRYGGIPFTDKGSSLAGSNCWGLVALIFRERTGVALDLYDTIAAGQLFRIARAMARESKADIWREVRSGELEVLDFVLMQSLKKNKRGRSLWIPDHVGILVSASHVIHIESGISSTVLPLDHFSIAPRIVSFHRHVSQ